MSFESLRITKYLVCIIILLYEVKPFVWSFVSSDVKYIGRISNVLSELTSCVLGEERGDQETEEWDQTTEGHVSSEWLSNLPGGKLQTETASWSIATWVWFGELSSSWAGSSWAKLGCAVLCYARFICIDYHFQSSFILEFLATADLHVDVYRIDNSIIQEK